MVPYTVTGKALARTGNTGYSGQPTSALFRAGDGRQISLGVVQQHQFETLAQVLGQAQWLTDARYTSPDTRRVHTVEIQAELSAALSTRTAAEWESVMSAAGIPCGMVREVGEAVDMPHLADRGLRLPLQIPGLPAEHAAVSVLNAGFCMGSDGPGVNVPPPRLDEHGAAVRAWLNRN